MFHKLEELFNAIAVILIVSVPLAIWKLIDIGIWVFSHIKVTIE